MRLDQKISKAVKNSKFYDLSHFHEVWENPSLRRLMGNELLYPPSPKVQEAILKYAPFVNYYPEDAISNVNLLRALAKYVGGIPEDEKWIALGNGSMEIIDMLPHTFINPGDEILLPAPEYTPYARRPLIYEAKIIDVLPDSSFNYKLEDFTSRMTPNTKMIIMSRPNAPIGNLVARDVVEQLCSKDVIVVVDEAYTEFSRQSVTDLVPKYPNLIISRTFSKAMGLGGIRLGFMVAQPEVIDFVNRIRVPENISVLTQAAALAALEDADYIRKNVDMVIASRNWFQDTVASVPGVAVYESEGNSVLLNVDGTGKTAEEFTQHLYKNNFVVRNLSGGRNLDGKGFFRVTVGTQQDMEQVAKLIGEFTKA